jgi:hypothetical protein
MKKIIFITTLIFGFSTNKAQTQVADFENFSLSPNSAYSNSLSLPFQSAGASFQYKWGGNYWSGGFSYTNKYDSATAGFTNLYGVKPLKGYNNSNVYAVAQDGGVINLSAPSNTVQGFYITNTTYAFKSMKLGDAFAKKFGGVSGNDPDFFKVTVKGFKNGILINDSVSFYLADFRFANNSLDYIVDTWQWVNTSTLGNIDSLKFFMYSSDVGNFGINTPLFFAMDNFTNTSSTVGLNEQTDVLNFSVFPNPFSNNLSISLNYISELTTIVISDVTGKIVYSSQLNQLNTTINLDELQEGIYFLELMNGTHKSVKKIIKN